MRPLALHRALQAVVVVLVTALLACSPPLTVKPVTYVKIDEANASTSVEPASKASQPPERAAEGKSASSEGRPPKTTATTSAASSETSSMEPDELLEAATSGSRKGAPADKNQCFKASKGCCGDAVGKAAKVGGRAACPKGSILGTSCKRRC